MSFSKADLPNLKWSLGAFVLSLTLAGILFSLSQTYLAYTVQNRQEAQKQLTDAQTQLDAAQNDQQNMATYAMEYNALMAKKIIGNEQRLDWIEGLEKLHKQGHVPDFKYTIAPQQVYTPAPPLDVGNFVLNFSPMTLQVDLLHEEQLLRLFSALRSEMQGWFILDRCSMSHDANSTGRSLKAECAGGWLTMKNRNAP